MFSKSNLRWVTVVLLLLSVLAVFDSYNNYAHDQTAVITGAVAKQPDIRHTISSGALTLEKGWQLISGSALQDYARNCKLKNVFLSFSPNENRIVREDAGNIRPDEGVFVQVDSDKCSLLVSYDKDAPLANINLKKGWNLIAITPQMVNKIPKDLPGTCSFAYDGGWMYMEGEYKWVKDVPFFGNEVGRGLWLYADADCSIRFSSLETEVKNGNIAGQEGCGDKCEEEPPLPPSTGVVTYCSRPLIVEDVREEYLPYQNVQKNKEAKDNRYFVYISKTSNENVELLIKNVKDAVVESLSKGKVVYQSLNKGEDSISIDGNDVLVVHANPTKKNPLLDLCGWWCDEKPLKLITPHDKTRFYPYDKCYDLVATQTYAQMRISEDKFSAEFGENYVGLESAVWSAIAAETVRNLYHDFETRPRVTVARLVIEGENHKIINEGDFDFVTAIKELKKPWSKSLESYAMVFGTEDARASVLFDVTDAIDYYQRNPNLGVEAFRTEKSVFLSITDMEKQFDYFDLLKREVKIKEPLLLTGNVHLHPNGLVSRSTSDLVNALATRYQFTARRDLQTYDIIVSGTDDSFTIFPYDTIDSRYAFARISSVESKALHEPGFMKSLNEQLASRDVAEVTTTFGLESALMPEVSFQKLESPSPQEKYRVALRPVVSLSLFKYALDENMRVIMDTTKQFAQQSLSVTQNPSEVAETINAYKRIVLRTRARVDDIQSALSKFSTVLTESEFKDAQTAIKDHYAFYDRLLASTDAMSSEIPGRKYPGSSLADRIYRNALMEFEVARLDIDRRSFSILQSFKEHLTETIREMQRNGILTESESKALFTESESKALVYKYAEDYVPDSNLLSSEPAVIERPLEALNTAENSKLKGSLITSKTTAAEIQEIAIKSGIKTFAVFDFATLFGPFMEDYGETINNANLVLAGKIINAVGVSSVPVVAGFTVKSIVSTGLAGGASAAGAAATGAASSFAIGLGVSYVTTSVGTTFYCAFNQGSGLCGCRVTDDYGGKPLLQLQKYNVVVGETIKYRILGFENCPTHPGLEALFGLQNLANAPAPPPTLKAGKHELKTLCEWQKDGRWCLGEFTVNLKPGEYELRILQPVIAASESNPIVFYPWDTKQKIVVVS